MRIERDFSTDEMAMILIGLEKYREFVDVNWNDFCGKTAVKQLDTHSKLVRAIKIGWGLEPDQPQTKHLACRCHELGVK